MALSQHPLANPKSLPHPLIYTKVQTLQVLTRLAKAIYKTGHLFCRLNPCDGKYIMATFLGQSL